MFSNEKLFDIDGVFNQKNHPILASLPNEADKNEAIFQKQKLPVKVMVWLVGFCKHHSRPVKFKSNSVDHQVVMS